MLSEGVTVKELAEKCNRAAKDVMAKLLHRGIFVTINQPLDPELAKEIARLGEAEDATPETPLLLATALAQTRQAVDTARALGLVQRVLGNTSPAAQPLHPLARLLEARLLQQRRLEDQLDRQTQQLRDTQRRNDQLSERLEAVRAIERSLSTRPAPAASPSAPAVGNGSAPRPAP
jgi:DNA repair ATPase RecN